MPSGVAKNPSTDRRRKDVREELAETKESPKRVLKRRTPFNAGAGRFKLSVVMTPEQKSALASYHLAWINAEKGKTDRAQAAGYDFVHKDEILEVGQTDVHSGNTDVGSRVSRVVGTTERNDELKAYLMKQPLDFYNEDQATLEEENAQVDIAIRGKSGDFGVANSYGNVQYDH